MALVRECVRTMQVKLARDSDTKNKADKPDIQVKGLILAQNERWRRG